MSSKAGSWLAVGAWAAVIFFISSCPGPVVPFELFPHQDKLGHFTQYFILGALLFRALGDVRYAPLWAVIISVVYGVTDELHQVFVANRIASVLDLCADTLGAVFAQVLIIARRRIAP